MIVTAHYDHVGNQGAADDKGDHIYNGANDDGSGTVSVVELASALATLKTRPKRSILFMTFFGEEKGLLGSRYYGRHPVVPIEKTVADVNLEQVGRTDDSEGPRVGCRRDDRVTATPTSPTSSPPPARPRGSGSTAILNSATLSSGVATTRHSPTWACPRIRSASRSCSPTTTARATTGTRSTTPTWPGSTAWSPTAC